MSYDTAITIRIEHELLAKIDAGREELTKSTGIPLSRATFVRLAITNMTGGEFLTKREKAVRKKVTDGIEQQGAKPKRR